MNILFDNTYAQLPERFFAKQESARVPEPKLIRLNLGLAAKLSLDADWLKSPDGVAILAGNAIPEGAEPIAQAYGGHQFGGFSPQLGDGRALLLGEVIGAGGARYDLQLKGSGRTRFSRGGDGKSALGPVLREYIVSEAMSALGVPTTRALAAVATGEKVMRQEGPLPGGVFTLTGFIELDREVFMEHYYAYVYVRIMQALGAYGFRGFYERKPHFLQSVPYALKNVSWLLDHVNLPIDLPALKGTFRSMVASEKFQSPPPPPEGENLTVRIVSFSFHRGMPKDETGHGGGFVFDARSIPNPGREERFKTSTGKDEPVIEYLNQQESVRQFLANVLSLVDASVSNYQSRRFQSLMVSFGCTGGQHRSVYLAERLAQHLRGRKGVEVLVRHRELENKDK